MKSNPTPLVHICHMSSVHGVWDTRIFMKECRSLSKAYEVSWLVPHGMKELKDGVRIIPLPKPQSRLMRFLWTDWVLLFKALAQNARLYHFHDPELIPAGLILRLFGKKVIYDVHENVLADLPEKKWLKAASAFAILYQGAEWMACRFFYLVLANKAYEPYYNNRKATFETVQNFPPLEVLHPLRKIEMQPSDTLLFVGALGARRGLPLLIEAILLLKRQGLRIRLLCIGHVTSEVEDILRQSEAYPEVRDQISFTGFQKLSEAYANAKHCFAGVSLAEDIENNRHTFTTKMFEYMACGLPVICSSFPVNREIIDKHRCGMCVNPSDMGEVADAIAYLYDHQQEAFEMGRRGMEAAKSFSWETEEKKLLTFYRKILS